MSYFNGGWPKYIPVAERRAKAARKLASLQKKGRICRPVIIAGNAITRTFWGKSWCQHLEAYSDFANRLPRGRTYARNGSVIDLQITAGDISALVSGSEIYEVNIKVSKLAPQRWQTILAECAGKVASLVELLQGRLSSAVMQVVTQRESGLLPQPQHIQFRCSCPDSAALCKHVAATLYGVGNRFDSQPELLFLLRRVDPQELILQAGSLPVTAAQNTPRQALDSDDLSALFGIELDTSPLAVPVAKLPTPTPVRAVAKSAKASPAKEKKKTSVTKRPKIATASELMARGLPRHMLQNWLLSGVLQPTEKRGVYRTSKQTESRIEDYLRRKRAKRL
jgi:uncharacterized Zn finger protein